MKNSTKTLLVTSLLVVMPVFYYSLPLITSAQSSNKPNVKGIVFFDDFEYAVGRSEKRARDIFIKEGGWNWVKTQQTQNRGGGYFYTVKSIPGYTGTFPGLKSNRILAIEMLPKTFGGQTDAFLQFGCGDCPEDTIPGDVWFQFWVYVNRFGKQSSSFSQKNKFIYPCNGSYPCNSNKWVLMIGPTSEAPHNVLVDSSSLFIYQRSNRAGNPSYTGGPYAPSKIGQTNASEYIKPNNWVLVKIHYDTTQPKGNKFEAWLRYKGKNWVKIVEWIGGVTPGFTWTIPVSQIGGHRVIRIPTTFPGGGRDELRDSWIYIDDFTIANSEQALPVY